MLFHVNHERNIKGAFTFVLLFGVCFHDLAQLHSIQKLTILAFASTVPQATLFMQTLVCSIGANVHKTAFTLRSLYPNKPN